MFIMLWPLQMRRRQYCTFYFLLLTLTRIPCLGLTSTVCGLSCTVDTFVAKKDNDSTLFLWTILLQRIMLDRFLINILFLQTSQCDELFGYDHISVRYLLRQFHWLFPHLSQTCFGMMMLRFKSTVYCSFPHGKWNLFYDLC